MLAHTLTEDFSHLHDVLAPVRDPEAFAGLFVSGGRAPGDPSPVT